MPLYSVCVMKYCGYQMTMFDVHVFESVSLLLSVQLISQGLPQVHPFNVEHHDQALIVTLVA